MYHVRFVRLENMRILVQQEIQTIQGWRQQNIALQCHRWSKTPQGTFKCTALSEQVKVREPSFTFKSKHSCSCQCDPQRHRWEHTDQCTNVLHNALPSYSQPYLASVCLAETQWLLWTRNQWAYIIHALSLIHFHDVKLYCHCTIDGPIMRKHLHAFLIRPFLFESFQISLCLWSSQFRNWKQCRRNPGNANGDSGGLNRGSK